MHVTSMSYQDVIAAALELNYLWYIIARPGSKQHDDRYIVCVM